MPITSIADRLTPSSPIEVTFGAQPIATGRKFTTLFGHRASAGGSAIDYLVHDVVNVGDYAAAKAEVEALAGTDAQIALMAEAFVKANALVSSSRNFPAFRIVILPNAEVHFGPAGEAITAIKFLRNDMLVSCYPASDSTNLATLVAAAQLMSGIDRDLQGQFGTEISVASLDVLSAQLAYAINKREVIVHTLPDTNTAAVVGSEGDTVLGSNKLINVTIVDGLYKGAQISGTGIPANTIVENFDASSITMSKAATATASAVDLTIQNVVSQKVEIVAAAGAAAMMQSVFPYNPLQQVAIGGLIPPQKPADRIAIDPNGASEQALSAGLSPLYVQPGNVVAFIRTRTTFTTLPGNIAVTAYFDWQDIVLLYDFREVCYQITQNPPFNNNPGGTKASARTAALLKDEVLREAQNFEDLGAFQGVKTLAKDFIVQNSTTSRGRFDFKIPVNVIPGLYVIAGNIQAVSGLSDFTL